MNDFLSGIRRHRSNSTVDVAPLMDMVFILLIFFIVTSTFTRETGVEVTKPKARSASAVEQQVIMVAITQSGTIHINDRQVSAKGLEDVLRQMIQKNPGREVIVVADKNSNSGIMVSVIDAANLAGAKKVSIAAQKD